MHGTHDMGLFSFHSGKLYCDRLESNGPTLGGATTTETEGYGTALTRALPASQPTNPVTARTAFWETQHTTRCRTISKSPRAARAYTHRTSTLREEGTIKEGPQHCGVLHGHEKVYMKGAWGQGFSVAPR
jgi:hypothetical protein